MTFIKKYLDSFKTWKSLKRWNRQILIPKIYKNKTVLISAFRNQTWIEWAIYASFVLYQNGYEVAVIYKGSEVKSIYSNKYFNFWIEAKKTNFVNFIDIEQICFDHSTFEKYLENNEHDSIASLAYDLKIESADINKNKSYFNIQLERLRVESAQNAARLFKLLEKNKFHQFILYSGLIYDTPGLLKAAQDSQQDVVCIEGWGWRAGHMIYNFNAPALEYNLRGWFKYFGKWDSIKEKEIKKYNDFLNGKRINEDWLIRFLSVQPKHIDLSIKERISKFLGNQKGFLLATNVIGDSSLLNRETIFSSHKDFLVQTIDYFRNNPELKLIIRVHPGEEIVKSKVKIKLGQYARKHSKGANNIFIIDAMEKLNTFSLIPFIKCGLVWISSIGVDLVARGIPVIAAAKPKYTGLGIVEEPFDTEQFFILIQKYSEETVPPTSEQIETAKRYLYVVFKGFSFEAQGRTFRAGSCQLNNMPNQLDHDRFFRIIMKEVPAPDQVS